MSSIAQKQAEMKKASAKKFIYRGHELKNILEMSMDAQVKLMRSRQRRRFAHGIQNKYDRLIKKVRKQIKDRSSAEEKPLPVRTHLRNCIIVPEMVQGVLEVYSGKYWNTVEVRSDMIGTYLGEYSMSYKPIRHGKVGVGATRSSKFTSLK